MPLLSRITSDGVDKFLKTIYRTDNWLMITLVDGTVLCGKLSVVYYRLFDEKSGQFSSPLMDKVRKLSSDNLIFDYMERGKEHFIFVPFNQISGSSIFSYNQENRETSWDDPAGVSTPLLGPKELEALDRRLRERYGSKGFKPEKKNVPSVDDSNLPVHRLLLKDLWDKALQHSFQREPVEVSYSITSGRPIKWGEITFKWNTPLYCDWEFLSRKKGGLNNLGVGFPLASFSAGWEKSLWGSFMKKVTQASTELGEINSKREVMISGFFHFLNPSKGIRLSNIIEMESGVWHPTILAEKRISDGVQLHDVAWALVYFKENSFMFPRNLWTKFSQEIRVYGEVVPANVETEFGQKECFLKARAAAYINEQQRSNAN